jgi:hypothetical protein
VKSAESWRSYTTRSSATKRLRRRRRLDWSAKLSRSFTLKNGDKIVTLADARAVMIRYFKPVMESQSVGIAMERLLQAAETGAFADCNEATDQVEIVLRARAVY